MTDTKIYNKLDCGCSYAIDNYEDNTYCSKHKNHDEIRLAIANDVKYRLIKKLENKSGWITKTLSNYKGKKIDKELEDK